jgi:DNA repair exonuclease SbcCD ATPase subunit
MTERAKLLEEIEKNIRLPIQTIENEVQTNDDEHEKLLEVNKSLKSALETIEDKIQHAITARSDPFGYIGGNPSERLDHLISTIQNQTGQIDVSRAEHSQIEEQLQNEIKQLQR